jgi:hypothetical protein
MMSCARVGVPSIAGHAGRTGDRRMVHDVVCRARRLLCACASTPQPTFPAVLFIGGV